MLDEIQGLAISVFVLQMQIYNFFNWGGLL